MLARGTKITCLKGHHIMTAARDIHVGDQQNPALDWTDWQQPEPEIGTLVPVCAICGQPWFGNGGHANTVHTDAGWWPS